MARILAVYATSRGQTEKVALRLRARLEALGHRAHAVRVEEAAPDLDPRDWDAVVAGGPVYYGRFPQALLDWLGQHRAGLAARPFGLFTVCLSVLSDLPEKRADADVYAAALAEAAGRAPDLSVVLAGGLRYSAYNVVLRWVVRRIARGVAGRVPGDPTDAGRDHEYTDWSAVDAFADALADVLAEPAGRPTAPARA